MVESHFIEVCMEAYCDRCCKTRLNEKVPATLMGVFDLTLGRSQSTEIFVQELDDEKGKAVFLVSCLESGKVELTEKGSSLK